MTETSLSPEATPIEAQSETDAADVLDDASPKKVLVAPSEQDRRVRYCPKCHARYVKGGTECVTCSVPLVLDQPRDFSLFRPGIDLPYFVALVLYVTLHNRLGGEAQSFGFIFLLVGFATIVTFRAISYAEWLGRR